MGEQDRAAPTIPKYAEFDDYCFWKKYSESFSSAKTGKIAFFCVKARLFFLEIFLTQEAQEAQETLDFS
ncbi:MAG: hypothetical protein DRR16_25970 [Candidatus Parabeggiatoa sp. nov. 3]|nr:MAG: hypothetical protein DRR00_09080 [Gammaproteobacteria bacterium]RKZ67570.1 MAG: hypothetical protein DRQ99_06275 [Gammaproteobacteria bacterium]RKZ79305.1 MAG: hypothetical protein DRR16_25970 [Gammaproteobacteria bacterium]